MYKAYQVILVAVSGLAIVFLSGCSATAKVKVPQSQVDGFLSCMKDPVSSYYYKRSSPSDIESIFSSKVPDISMLTVQKAAHAGGQFFVTNDKIPQAERYYGSISKTSKDTFANGVFRATATDSELDSVIAKVDEFWNSPVHQTFLTSFNHLADSSSKDVQLDTSISVGSLHEYLESAGDLAETDGFRAYAFRALVAFKASKDAQGDTSLATRLNAQKAIGSIFVTAYLKAYFRNGRFLKVATGNPIEDLVKLAKSTSGGDRQLIEKLLAALPKDAIADLDKIIEKLAEGTIGKVSESGFISRGGDALAVPPLSVSLDVASVGKKLTVSSIDVDGVASDIVRVILEALFDSLNYVPAVSKATGVVDVGRTEKTVSLPEFSKVTKKEGSKDQVMSDDQFGEVERLGATAHSATASLTGTLIRSINVAALNNEGVAKTLAALTGTIARKVAERVGWCYYATINEAGAGPQGQRTVKIRVWY